MVFFKRKITNMPTQKTCSACKQAGHTKRSKMCPKKQQTEQSSADTAEQSSADTVEQSSADTAEQSSADTAEQSSADTATSSHVAVNSPKVKTEDLGKIFEKAICDWMEIPYKGKYKYTTPEQIAKCEEIARKLDKLRELIPPGNSEHTAENGARYDFTFTRESRELKSTTDDVSYWSAKTTKKSGKVAPQVIGQPSIAKFREMIGCGNLPVAELKQYIQSQDNLARILQLLFDYTFSCPVIYFNEATDDIKYIQSLNSIRWAGLKFDWTKQHADWKNSSTLRVKRNPTDDWVSLIEFQFHTKRKNMAIRWCFENFLSLFASDFEIIEIHKKQQPVQDQQQRQGLNSPVPTAIFVADNALVPKKQVDRTKSQSKRVLAPKCLNLELQAVVNH